MGGELYGRRGCTAEDAKFDKTLTIDISRKLRHPIVIMSVDAANCYDRVNHIIMSLLWFALLKGFRSPIQAALQSLQQMKFYQRTGFGDSTSFLSCCEDKYFMGLGQGSRAAPAAWCQLSAVINNVFKKYAKGCSMFSPISRKCISSMGVSYVDDTDLICWDDDATSISQLSRLRSRIFFFGVIFCERRAATLS